MQLAVTSRANYYKKALKFVETQISDAKLLNENSIYKPNGIFVTSL